ncbi:hypothetical protein B0F90DRAFT_1696709 [Multifurca ochricompacta]|uniref:Flavin-containing monooxygenase n=1 Tax=Multifurca ochricompacta TaxID=376703 RepID=A0AAD4M9A7_9AGAM|nr:hypothetical protein B0F90DRAFT_1696709 [Multifurca ochricompacta]
MTRRFRLLSNNSMRSLFNLTLTLSLLPFSFQHGQIPLDLGNTNSTLPNVPNKRIAIIGGGTAGIIMLKTLITDLPEEVTRNWEIVLFEQRDNIGGLW